MVRRKTIKLPKDMPKYCPDDGTKLKKQPLLSKIKGRRVIIDGGLHCSTCNRRFFDNGPDPFEGINPNNTRL